MNRRILRKTTITAIGISAALILLSPATILAQSDDADGSYGESTLEEITVTAHKRVESLQEVRFKPGE